MEILIFVLYGLLLWLMLHILFVAYTFIKRKVILSKRYKLNCWDINDSVFRALSKRFYELNAKLIHFPAGHINYPYVIKSDIEIKKVNCYSEQFELISIKKESRYQDYLCFKAFSYNLSKTNEKFFGEVFWYEC